MRFYLMIEVFDDDSRIIDDECKILCVYTFFNQIVFDDSI